MKICKSEARQLAVQISHNVGYKTIARAGKSITSETGKVFRAGPEAAFTGNQAASKQYPGFVWLSATSQHLVGAKEEDIQLRLGPEFMQRIFRAAQAAKYPRGNAWITLGQIRRNPKQHAMQLNRVITTRQRLDALIARLVSRAGRLAATFAYAAKQLGYNGTPGWIAKHFPAVKADGGAIFRYNISGKEVVAIEFGSRAPGVVSNAHIQKGIRNAVEKRKHMILKKVQNVLSGYTYDWNTGQSFKVSTGQRMIDQLDANAELYDSM